MGVHISEDKMTARLKAAEQVAKIGGTYQHYKLGNKYKVLDLVIQESDNEIMVIYQALHGDRLKFARPATIWAETGEWQGHSVPRFKLLA